MGRSIVLFGPDFSHERFACANIEPDHDIVKYILLQKPPKFVVYVKRRNMFIIYFGTCLYDFNLLNKLSSALNFWRTSAK